MGISDHRGQFRYDLTDISTDLFINIHGKQRTGRAVRKIDASLSIDTYDARGNPAKNSLDKMTPFVELAVCLNQFMTLPLKLIRHPVECSAQKAEFIRIRPFFHPSGQITRPDTLSSTR